MKERKKVSMKQIAEQLSVSLGTVSLVLNGRGDEMQDFGRDTEADSGYSKEIGVPTTKADGREKGNRDFSVGL